jgi:O-antigen/teichoic acid export membrane protein
MSGALRRLANPEFAWVAFGQAFALGGAFAGVKLLTNLLSQDEYGRLALALAVAGTLGSFSYGPLAQSCLRYVSVFRERGELASLLAANRRLYAGLAGAVTIAGTAVWALSHAFGISGQWANLVFWALAFAVTSGTTDGLVALRSAQRDRKGAALLQGASICGRVAGAVIALRIGPATAEAALAGYSIASLVVLAAQLRVLAAGVGPQPTTGRPLQPQVVAEAASLSLRYAGSFVWFSAFAAVGLYADRWIIAAQRGVEDAGAYFALYQIANAPVVLLFGALSQYAAPVLFDRLNYGEASSSARFLVRIVALSAATSTVLVGCTALSSEIVVRLLAAEAYTAHHGTLWILVAAACVFNVGQVLVLTGLGRRQPQIYIVPKALHAASFAVLALGLVQPMGIRGVAWASLCASLLYVLAVHLANRRARAA